MTFGWAGFGRPPALCSAETVSIYRTADQELERCSVAKNHTQELARTPALASAHFPETVLQSTHSISRHTVLSQRVELGIRRCFPEGSSQIKDKYNTWIASQNNPTTKGPILPVCGRLV